MRRFDELQAFVAVVEAGSFTAAADRLDTAKSALSRRVSGNAANGFQRNIDDGIARHAVAFDA